MNSITSQIYENVKQKIESKFLIFWKTKKKRTFRVRLRTFQRQRELRRRRLAWQRRDLRRQTTLRQRMHWLRFAERYETIHLLMLYFRKITKQQYKKKKIIIIILWIFKSKQYTKTKNRNRSTIEMKVAKLAAFIAAPRGDIALMTWHSLSAPQVKRLCCMTLKWMNNFCFFFS